MSRGEGRGEGLTGKGGARGGRERFLQLSSSARWVVSSPPRELLVRADNRPHPSSSRERIRAPLTPTPTPTLTLTTLSG